MQTDTSKPLKLLIVTSSLDLRLPYGGADIWWNLFMALYQLGVDLVVTVYQGRMIPSPFWQSYENPCYWEGHWFARLKEWGERLSLNQTAEKTQLFGWKDRFILNLTRTIIRPRWKQHLFRILSRQDDVDAVLFFNMPLNQLRGIPAAIRERYNLPVLLYDTDIPVSLPGSHGFGTGFNIYPDADLTEYDLFLSPSVGGIDELKKLGIKNAKPFLFAANPDVFAPVAVSQQDIDVFFYGFGTYGRHDWMTYMLTEPSRQMPDSRFVIRGKNIHMDLGNARLIENIPISRLREYCCRSKINVNIVRNGHASVYGSSTTRPFALASMECCMVCNPYPGLEMWLEPGKEVFVVNDPGEVVDLYRWLLAHDTIRKKTGQLARKRVLKEHTYHHRARQLIQIIKEMK